MAAGDGGGGGKPESRPQASQRVRAVFSGGARDIGRNLLDDGRGLA
tara:strand:- start:4494 stop:4631 length:138 start_codon:yes stop_codon:yes gene_type:complete